MKIETQKSMMTRKFNRMILGGTLSIMVVSVMLMSDSLIAGVLVGSDAVAGITSVLPLYSVAAFFSTIISLAVPILYSSEIGSFHKKEADRIFQTGVFMAVVTGVVLFLLVSLFGEKFLQINRPSEEMFASAKQYLEFIRFTILLLPLSAILAECVYADGDETISTIANLVQAVGNVAGSIILCRIMGVRGISLSSFIFYLVSILILSLHFFKKSNTLKLGFAFSFDILKKTVGYSVIDASTYLSMGVMVEGLNILVGRGFGADALILVSVFSLSGNLYLVFDGIGEAITPIISIYLSEGCNAGVRKVYDRARVTAVTEGVIVMIITCLVAPLVPEVLQIRDAVMSRYAVDGLRIISTGAVFVALLYFMSSYDILVDRIPLGLFTCLLRDLLFPLPLAYILSRFLGLRGMFAGIALGSLCAFILISFYQRKKYTGDTPLLLGDKKDLPSYLYEYGICKDQIMKTRDEIAKDLLTRGYSKKVVNRAILLFEEVNMLVYDKNSDESIEGECAVILFDDRIRMVFRDSGDLFDITDSDMDVSSLRSYVVSSVASRVSLRKQHQSAMSFNRNILELRID